MKMVVSMINFKGDPDSIRVSIVSRLAARGVPLSVAKSSMESWLNNGTLSVEVESEQSAGEIVTDCVGLGFERIEVEVLSGS